MVPSSMSAGNTVISDHGLAMSAKGSMPIDDFANVAANNLPLPVDDYPGREDPAHIIGPAGAKSARPGQAGATNVNDAFGHIGGWRET